MNFIAGHALIRTIGLLAVLFVHPARAAEDYPIHVVVPLTGSVLVHGPSATPLLGWCCDGDPL
jgi:hypothetical protein